MSLEATPRVLFVIPTLGTRIDYLEQTLRSVRDQQVAVDLVLVCPASAAEARAIGERFGARWVPDPGSLPGAINAGVATAHATTQFVTWLGDDDLLTPDSLRRTVTALEHNPRASVAYGACVYIDAQGRRLWVSRAGSLAQWILTWGPQLIPQPGMLVRRQAWDSVGGLDESFRFAFDFDLLLKLRRFGTFVAIPDEVSCFRWHRGSLTVSDRTTNLHESETAKRRYLRPWQRRMKWTWEAPVRIATRIAAGEVDRRARRVSARMDET